MSFCIKYQEGDKDKEEFFNSWYLATIRSNELRKSGHKTKIVEKPSFYNTGYGGKTLSPAEGKLKKSLTQRNALDRAFIRGQKGKRVK